MSGTGHGGSRQARRGGGAVTSKSFAAGRCHVACGRARRPGRARAGQRPLGWLDALAVAVWLTGFVFEALGDWQLKRFRADPANKGRLMRAGVWRYTRRRTTLVTPPLVGPRRGCGRRRLVNGLQSSFDNIPAGARERCGHAQEHVTRVETRLPRAYIQSTRPSSTAASPPTRQVTGAGPDARASCL